MAELDVQYIISSLSLEETDADINGPLTLTDIEDLIKVFEGN